MTWRDVRIWGPQVLKNTKNSRPVSPISTQIIANYKRLLFMVKTIKEYILFMDDTLATKAHSDLQIPVNVELS